MSGKDETPDYLKGVDQVGFNEADNFTVKTAEAGPLGHKAYNKHHDDDDDDDDDDELGPGFRVPWLLILLAVVVMGALASLGVAGIVATGTWIADQDRAALAEGGRLAKTIQEERKIVDELGSQGANRRTLAEMYTAIEPATGHDRGLKALLFAVQVDEEVASIGDIRGTRVEDRHKKIAIAQQAYVDTLRAWDSAANNPIGRIAIGVGLAEAPPVH